MQSRHQTEVDARAKRPRARLRLRPFQLALTLGFCAGLPASAQIVGGAPGAAARSVDADAVKAAYALAAALHEEALLPGIAVAVGSRERGIVFSEGYGFADLRTRAPATPLTTWRIGSVSKSLTAAGALLLDERGRLDPDATVADLLPGWERAFLLLHPDEGLVVAMAANRSTAPLFEEEAQAFAHFFLDHGSATTAELDRDLAGAWTVTATMGENMEHEGSLRLHADGRIRGMLELGDAHSPVRIVVVDRHGEELRLVGAGAHGVMIAWLRPASGGWTGRWEYLGMSGDLVLREVSQ